MSKTAHTEHHFKASESVRDVVIGMADGLTVPFALAAGLTGAVTASTLIVTAGLAEIAAGSIAMGLGGYLAARSEAEHYVSERQREEREIVEKTDVEIAETLEILETYGLTPAQSKPVVAALRKDPPGWIS
jgi:vacuolar iron transporter family protein